MKNRILFFDIETTPNKGYCWGSWKQNIIKFEEEYNLLCFAYKWDGGRTKVIGLDDFNWNNLKLVKELRNLLDECEICCGHNVDRFDIRMANTFFLKYGLTPPSPYKTIDTLKIARRRFRFNSNKLNDLGVFLGVGKKKDTGGFDLWTDCMKKDKTAWKKMKSYNKNDVNLLEKIYLRLRPWATNINVNISKGLLCPTCGSNKLQKRGHSITIKGLFQRYQCTDCGHWLQERISK
jgi:uncharacterized protein YprB with RNaseH-like and TPR domain